MRPILQRRPTSKPTGEIARILVEIVADKTGYPLDMLELDMRLDTDLGIDSIKRVEIFSAIQERLPTAPAAGPEQIGTLVLCGRSWLFWVGPANRRRAITPSRIGAATERGRRHGIDSSVVLLEAVADKTGYPIDMLELDMQLDTDLGIDSIKRVEILSAVQDRLPLRRDRSRATRDACVRFGRSLTGSRRKARFLRRGPPLSMPLRSALPPTCQSES